MSARIPVRRLGQSCLAAARPRSKCWVPSSRAFTTSSPRPAKGKKEEEVDLSNPLLDEYLSKRGQERRPTRPVPQTGDLSKNSVFEKEFEIPGYRHGMTKEEIEALKEENEAKEKEIEAKKEKELHAAALDPVPAARRDYEKKLLIRSLKNPRVSKTLRLKRTEREMVYKSQDFPTSMKKMTRLIHQIKGKTVEEALIQMRFSKKRIARDIVKALQLARDEAIAARGMGLGAGVDPTLKGRGPYLADGTRRREVKNAEGTVIELKGGKKKTVVDPTEIYIDQAWSNPGPSQKSVEFRARGRVNTILHRTAKFSVLLKEEKTRMRISEEIKKKRENKPLWLPLPDRPVTSQRQYCLW